ncbi:MAG TPA: 4Fe-4S dicluster domain-containing protein [Candidatus Ozemobacteraceae bacterium]|nr:4Fe-4S dicluster domain-containing protein [Candidatus Ozemobacteraceae bacterium]
MADPVTRAEFLRRMGRFTAGFFGTIADLVFGDSLETIARLFPTFLRPPGALPEGEFLETCTRCGTCVSACPHFAIRRVLLPDSFDEGTPFLSPRDAYCHLCHDLPCVTACPSGALRPPPRGQPLRIGTARTDADSCLRSSGDACTACVSACPDRFAALSLTGGSTPPTVDAGRCSGCGACESACPVRPDPAITVHPTASR